MWKQTQLKTRKTTEWQSLSETVAAAGLTETNQLYRKKKSSLFYKFIQNKQQRQIILQTCHLDAVNHNESTILSMNLAILMSRFDSPPQSCVVSVIWTCVNKNNVCFTDTQILTLQGQMEHKIRLFTLLGLTKHLQSKKNQKIVQGKSNISQNWEIGSLVVELHQSFVVGSDSVQLLKLQLVADSDTDPRFGFGLVKMHTGTVPARWCQKSSSN